MELYSQASIANDLPRKRVEDLAFVRLLCLSRAIDPQQIQSVRRDWNALTFRERLIIIDHSVQDGIVQPAILFLFLPLLYANAQMNSFVGLQRALAIQAELLEFLRMQRLIDQSSGMTIRIDVSELAIFAKAVNTSIGFETVLERISVRRKDRNSWVVSLGQEQGTLETSGQNLPGMLPGMLQVLNRIVRNQNMHDRDARQVDLSQCFPDAGPVNAHPTLPETCHCDI